MLVTRASSFRDKSKTVPAHLHHAPPNGASPVTFPPSCRSWRHALLAVVLGLGAASAGLAQGIDWTLSGGVAQEASVKKLGVIAGWTRPAPLWQGEQWRLKLRHELELAAWDVPKARDLIELGYSPVLRLERPLAQARHFFVEASIGLRLLSHTRVAPDHALATAFHFSDMLGVGMQWGRDGRSTLGVRYQHLSNLGIKRPNLGMDFVQLYYTHRF